MDLSIAIVSWNTRRLLDECLESIFETTHGIELEVIVVDNASSDGSAEMVRGKYPQVRLIENANNVGFAAANNQAYAVTESEFFMLLNPDTIALSSFGPIVRFMRENQDTGVVGCKSLNPDGSIQPSWYDYYPCFQWELLSARGRGLLVRMLFHRDPGSSFDTRWVGGQCLTVRRRCASEVGLMDEGYFMYNEETDWCYRIRRAGWRIVYRPDVEIVHLGGQSTKQASAKMLVELFRSKTRFMRIHYSRMHVVLFKWALRLRTGALTTWMRVCSPGGSDDPRIRALTQLSREIRFF